MPVTYAKLALALKITDTQDRFRRGSSVADDDNAEGGGARERKKSLPKGTIIGMPVRDAAGRNRNLTPHGFPAPPQEPNEPATTKHAVARIGTRPASPLQQTAAGTGPAVPLPSLPTPNAQARGPIPKFSGVPLDRPAGAPPEDAAATALHRADANAESALSLALAPHSGAPASPLEAPKPTRRGPEGDPQPLGTRMDSDPPGTGAIPSPEPPAPPAGATAKATAPEISAEPTRGGNPIVRGLAVGMGGAAVLVVAAAGFIWYMQPEAVTNATARGSASRGTATRTAPKPTSVAAKPPAPAPTAANEPATDPATADPAKSPAEPAEAAPTET
ncbi:MAG: hypothetical protein KC417_07890, partial [Myxococcales bacterium]|nr:hypothetical protein [Myxococcales bacterium]